MWCCCSHFTITVAKMWLELGKSCIFSLFTVPYPVSLLHTLISLSSLWKTDSPCEPGAHLYLGSSALLWQITNVLIEWGNWIMVPGNEFSTFGLRHPSQTDSYYLLKDPEARVANYTPHNSPNQWKKKKKKKQLPAIFTACLRGRAPCLSVCVCDRRRESKRLKWNNPPLYVKSDWNILAISHRLAYIIWEA